MAKSSFPAPDYQIARVGLPNPSEPLIFWKGSSYFEAEGSPGILIGLQKMEQLEILPLLTLNLDEILPIVTGYESNEKYVVEKCESDEQTIFNIRLVKLEKPYKNAFEEDLNDEDFRRYAEFLPQGYSFGAYLEGRLVAYVISEEIPWNRSLRIHEFHVAREFQRRGIGRALMNHVFTIATQDQFRVVFAETQNTNVNAIRFYRGVGFSLDALDLSFYTNHDVEDGEVAFFMKKKLE